MRAAPTTSHLNEVVQSPSLPRGKPKWLVNSPRVSSLGDSFTDNFLFIFYFCYPLRGHIWTAFLTQMTAPTFFTVPTIFFSLFSHPKSPLYLSRPPLLLIFMLLLISGDIYPNPGPIDPCSVCSRKVTWRNRSVQCTKCSLWAHLSCSGLCSRDFRKISPDTLGLVQCAHPSLKLPSPSYNLTSYLHPQTPTNPHLHLQTPTIKPSSSKMKPPKTTLHH